MANVVEIIIKAVDRTKEGLNAPITGLDSIVSAAGKMRFALIGAAGAAMTAITALGKSAQDTADRFYDLSQITGISVEQLSTLDYVARQSGIDIETLANAIVKMSRSMIEAGKEGSKVGAAYAALGIPVKDASGKFRDTNEVLLQVADRFASMENGAVKTALAIKIFGKSGAEMIPFLNQGSDAIRKMQEEAKSLGLEISSKTAGYADDFGDSMSKLGGVSKRLGIVFMEDLLPTLSRFAREILESAKNGGVLYNIVSGLGAVIGFLGKIVFTAWESVKWAFTSIVNIIVDAMVIFDAFMRGEIRNGIELAKTSFKDFDQSTGQAVQNILDTWMEKGPQIQEQIQKSTGPTEEDLMTAKERWKIAQEQAKEYMDSLSPEVTNYFKAWTEAAMAARAGVMTLLMDIANTMNTSLSSAISDLVRKTKNIKEAWVDVRDAMIKSVVDFIAKKVVAFATEKVLAAGALAVLGAQTTASILAAGAIAKAWSGAAAAVSLASFGANAAPAIAGMTSAYGTSRALASSMAAYERGTEYVPNTGVALVHKGERVVQEDANEKLTDFLDSNPKGQSVVQLIMDGRVLAQTIVDLSRSGQLPVEVKI